MIGAVFQVLADLGLLESGPGRPYPPYNVHLLRKPNIEVFVGGGEFFHIKLANAGDDSLAHEYDAMIEAYAVLPDRLSQPIAYRQLDGTNLLVTAGVRHRRAAPEVVHQPHPGVAGALNAYFETADKVFRSADAERTHGGRVREVVSELASNGIGEKLEHMRDALDLDFVDRLPRIKQHGDFTLNNMGLGDRGLVIFDWEEFGKECLPGLDLCMLIASSLAFEPERVARFFEDSESSPLRQVVQRFCQTYEIEVAVFRGLVPLYLATFLRSKEANLYKSPVKQKTLNLISKL